MKKNFLMLFVCFLMVSCVINVTVSRAQDQPYLLITEEWPPYNYEENGVVKGFATEVVRAIMQELQVDYPIELYSGNRVHAMMEEETGLMVFVLFRTPEREHRFKWIGPIADGTVYLYKKKGNPLVIETVEDVKRGGYYIACPSKGVVFTALQELGLNNLDVSSNRPAEAKKTVEGRTDLMANMPHLGVQNLLRQEGYPPDILEQTPVQVLNYPMYILATKDIPDSVIQEWQNVLDHMKATGRFDVIYQKHLKRLEE